MSSTNHQPLCIARSVVCVLENARDAKVTVTPDGAIPEWGGTVNGVALQYLEDGTKDCECVWPTYKWNIVESHGIELHSGELQVDAPNAFAAWSAAVAKNLAVGTAFYVERTK